MFYVIINIMVKRTNMRKFIKKFSKNLTKENWKSILMALLALVIVLTAVRGGLHLLDKYSVASVTEDGIGYPIRGVDVSHYQGTVDWHQLKKQGISFAFIKATEGTTFVDDKFKENWRKAHRAHIKRGAYHFYHFEDDPIMQAKQFTKVVPKKKDALPPVIDFETYGKYVNSPPPEAATVENLRIFMNIIEDKYDQPPIIYCNRYCYSKYISGNFDNPIWLADPSMSPALPDGRQWEFLQYSFYGVLEGYDGMKHIDLDLFWGSKKDYWEKYY